MNRIKLTRTEYTNLSPKDNNTDYLIKNEGKMYRGSTQYWNEYGDYFDPTAHQKVGGQIFFVYPYSNGATYTFYNETGTVLSTQTVEGLATAKYYDVTGTPSADKFYVLNTSVGTNGLGEGTTNQTDAQNIQLSGIGYGRRTSDYMVQNHGNDEGSVWQWLKNTVNSNGNSTGCVDWYIGGAVFFVGEDDTHSELGQLRIAIANNPTIFVNQQEWFTSSYNIVSSTGMQRTRLGRQIYGMSYWSGSNWYCSTSDTKTFSACAIRSF